MHVVKQFKVQAVRRFRCPLDHFRAFFGVGSPHLDLRVHRAVLNQEWGVGRAVPVLDWQLLTFSLLWAALVLKTAGL